MTNPTPEARVCYRHPGREANIRCQRCGRSICPDCMRDAAVGFHCPSCVAEGSKSTRQARAPYGGTRSGNPALTSYALIGINVAVWLAVLGTGWSESRLVTRLALVPRGICESLAQPGSFYRTGTEVGCDSVGRDGRWVPGVADGAYWELITSAFMHVQPWHIASNMLALYLFGPQLEAILGRARFLVVYLVSGLTGSAVVFWLAAPDGYTLGASGAIFGLLGAVLVLVRKTGGDVRSVLALLAINVVLTFAIPNISWQGHLGGFLGGLVVTGVLVYAPRERRTLVQSLAVGGLLGRVALAVVLRATALY